MKKTYPSVHQLIDLLGFTQAKVDITDTPEQIKVSLTLPQNESGALIGYHGETIDALQLICALMINHQNDNFIPVEVDVNGYRAARQQSLEDMADEAADNAINSGREIILPPLTGRERRLVHLHLQQRAEVATYSEGEGRARRLIIRPQSIDQ